MATLDNLKFNTNVEVEGGLSVGEDITINGESLKEKIEENETNIASLHDADGNLVCESLKIGATVLNEDKLIKSDKQSDYFKVQDNQGLVINEGVASGEYSIAGGTTDGSALKDLTGSLVTPTLTPAEASGALSLSFGANTKSISAGSLSLGYNAQAGIKGYYYNSIKFVGDGTAKILLAKTQTLDSLSTSSSAFEQDLKDHLLLETDKTVSSLGWQVGDYISLVNGTTRYPFCGKITNVAFEDHTFTRNYIITSWTKTISCMTITVDALPFTTSEDTPTIKYPYHNSIFAIKRVENSGKDADITIRDGMIELGWGAVSIGANTAAGSFSQAFGYNTIAASDFGFSEGRNTVAGYAAHAEGNSTKAIGGQSHAEGGSTEAIGSNAHSEGYHTVASAFGAHSEGSMTEATGRQAHAEGLKTKASGQSAHAEGNESEAIGDNSHAGGTMSIAEHSGSFVHGNHLSSGANYQAVFGKYNEVDPDAALIVGRGWSDTEKHNAFVVKSDGRATVGKNPTEPMDVATLSTVTDAKQTADNTYLKKSTVKAEVVYTHVGNDTDGYRDGTLRMTSGYTYRDTTSGTNKTASWTIAQRNGIGSITVPTPTSNTDAANKKYVDDADENLDHNISDVRGIAERADSTATSAYSRADEAYSLAESNYYRIEHVDVAVSEVTSAFGEFANKFDGDDYTESPITEEIYVPRKGELGPEDLGNDTLHNVVYSIHDQLFELNENADTAVLANDTANKALNIAKGKNQAKVFDTENDMREWIQNDAIYEIDLVGKTLPAGTTIIYSVDDVPSNIQPESSSAVTEFYLNDDIVLSYNDYESVSVDRNRVFVVYTLQEETTITYINAFLQYYNGNDSASCYENPRWSCTETAVDINNIDYNLIEPHNLFVGDNLYIRELNVPDYWWDGSDVQPLETQKVDLEEIDEIRQIAENAVPRSTTLGVYAHDYDSATGGYIDRTISYSPYSTRAWSIVQRDGQKHIACADPVNNDHVATKGYVDKLIPQAKRIVYIEPRYEEMDRGAYDYNYIGDEALAELLKPHMEDLPTETTTYGYAEIPLESLVSTYYDWNFGLEIEESQEHSWEIVFIDENRQNYGSATSTEPWVMTQSGIHYFARIPFYYEQTANGCVLLDYPKIEIEQSYGVTDLYVYYELDLEDGCNYILKDADTRGDYEEVENHIIINGIELTTFDKDFESIISFNKFVGAYYGLENNNIVNIKKFQFTMKDYNTIKIFNPHFKDNELYAIGESYSL